MLWQRFQGAHNTDKPYAHKRVYVQNKKNLREIILPFCSALSRGSGRVSSHGLSPVLLGFNISHAWNLFCVGHPAQFTQDPLGQPRQHPLCCKCTWVQVIWGLNLEAGCINPVPSCGPWPVWKCGKEGDQTFPLLLYLAEFFCFSAAIEEHERPQFS